MLSLTPSRDAVGYIQVLFHTLLLDRSPGKVLDGSFREVAFAKFWLMLCEQRDLRGELAGILTKGEH